MSKSKIPKLFDLLTERNISQAQLSRDTGLKSGSIGDWKSGRSKPSHDALRILCEYLNVPLDYFDDDPSGKPASAPQTSITLNPDRVQIGIISPKVELSASEKLLLERFRKLDDVGQGQLLERALVLSEKSARPQSWRTKGTRMRSDLKAAHIDPSFNNDSVVVVNSDKFTTYCIKSAEIIDDIEAHLKKK